MNIIDSILGVWTSVMTWFGGAFDNLIPIFYEADKGLTFIGYLAVGGMAISAAFLFFRLIKGWLSFGR